MNDPREAALLLDRFVGLDIAFLAGGTGVGGRGLSALADEDAEESEDAIRVGGG